MAGINKPNLRISRLRLNSKKAIETKTIVIIIILLIIFAIVMINFSTLSAKGSKTTEQIKSTVTDVFPQLAGEDFYQIYLDGLYDPPVTLYAYVFANGTPRAGFSAMDFVVKDNDVSRIKTSFESYSSQHIVFLVDSTDQETVDNAKEVITSILEAQGIGFNSYYSLADFKGTRSEVIDNKVVDILNINYVNFTYEDQEILDGLQNISVDSSMDPYLLDSLLNAIGRLTYQNETLAEGEIDARVVVLFPSTQDSSGPVEYSQDGTKIDYTEDQLKKMIGAILNVENYYIYVYYPYCDNNYGVLTKKDELIEYDFSSDLAFLQDYTQTYCFNDSSYLAYNLFLDLSKVKITYVPLTTSDTKHTIEVTLNPGGSYTGHGNLTDKTYAFN